MALSVSIEFVSSSARVTSVKFAKVAQFVKDNRIHTSDQGHLGPIKTETTEGKFDIVILWQFPTVAMF